MLAWLSSITTSTSRAGFHFRENVEIILSKFIDIVSLKKMLPVKLVSFQRRPKIYSAIFYFELVRSVRFDLIGLNHSGSLTSQHLERLETLAAADMGSNLGKAKRQKESA